jgi:translation initiation factor 1 (eIF-1/SUI1)
MPRTDPPRDESARGDPLRDGLKHNPFAKLRPRAESGEVESAAPDRPSARADEAPPAIGAKRKTGLPNKKAEATRDLGPAHERIVVRRERKGHGGKAVTIAAGAGLDGQDLTVLAREAAKALGAGARVEDGALVVQGEQTERLIAWLASRGFKSIVRGN